MNRMLKIWGQLPQRGWALAVTLAWLTCASSALAAGPGELCAEGAVERSCDRGLACEIRWSFGAFRLGTCIQAERVCGGLTGAACARDEYCNYEPEALCGAADQTGTCQPTPELCTREYRPVCGCDDLTYGNACEAAGAGVSVLHEGACQACREDEDCPHGACETFMSCLGSNCPPPPPSRCTVCGDGTSLRCKRAALPCPDGQVREIVQGCYGSCVDRASCRASGCDYGGALYEEGESFPADDGCNTCSCGSDGRVMCTLKACLCPDEDPTRTYVSRDREECTRIDFRCLNSERQFTDTCGCGCEALGSE
jgi:hypothetical protein